MTTGFLVHGGLWDAMDAASFWRTPGIVGALEAHGCPLRGVRDEDLARLGIPVAMLPSLLENPSHQRKTVDALLSLIRGSQELPGSPEPPTPRFPPHKDDQVAALAA